MTNCGNFFEVGTKRETKKKKAIIDLGFTQYHFTEEQWERKRGNAFKKIITALTDSVSV